MYHILKWFISVIGWNLSKSHHDRDFNRKAGVYIFINKI
jgi:hypothetical protein